MTSRSEVYAAIDSERNYQESFIEKDPTRCDSSLPEHSVGDYLTMLTTYVRKSQDGWTLNAGNSVALDEIRKIAAIAVHCMEDHGAIFRIPKSE